MTSRARASLAVDDKKRTSFVGLDSLFGGSIKKDGLDADWQRVSGEMLVRLLWAFDQLGGSVTLSTTKKGNAYVVKGYIGKAFEPIYFDGDDEGRAAFAEWVDQLVEMVALQV